MSLRTIFRIFTAGFIFLLQFLIAKQTKSELTLLEPCTIILLRRSDMGGPMNTRIYTYNLQIWNWPMNTEECCSNTHIKGHDVIQLSSHWPTLISIGRQRWTLCRQTVLNACNHQRYSRLLVCVVHTTKAWWSFQQVLWHALVYTTLVGSRLDGQVPHSW